MAGSEESRSRYISTSLMGNGAGVTLTLGVDILGGDTTLTAHTVA